MIEQEQFHTSPRVELCKAKAGQDPLRIDELGKLLFDNPLRTVIAETKLAIEDQPRIWVEKPREVERRKLYVLSANIEAHGHMGSCPGYALLTLHGKATKPRKDEV